MKYFDEFKKILAENNVNVDNISLETKLLSMGIDSLDLVEIVMDVEEKYGIEFSNEELQTLITVQDFLKAIETKM